MRFPLVTRRKYEHELEAAQSERDVWALRYEELSLSYDPLRDEYVKVQGACENALDFIERLWNMISVGEVTKMFDAVLDDALPLLKKHSLKYKEVDVAEAKANVAGRIQAS